jgi:hypothetical protein
MDCPVEGCDGCHRAKNFLVENFSALHGETPGALAV